MPVKELCILSQFEYEIKAERYSILVRLIRIKGLWENLWNSPRFRGVKHAFRTLNPQIRGTTTGIPNEPTDKL